jgi:hypothetical protein
MPHFQSCCLIANTTSPRPIVWPYRLQYSFKLCGAIFLELPFAIPVLALSLFNPPLYASQQLYSISLFVY